MIAASGSAGEVWSSGYFGGPLPPLGSGPAVLQLLRNGMEWKQNWGLRHGNLEAVMGMGYFGITEMLSKMNRKDRELVKGFLTVRLSDSHLVGRRKHKTRFPSFSS